MTAGLCLFAWRTLSPSLYGADDKTAMVADGEGLLHRLELGYHLPMAGVSAALMLDHSPVRPPQWRLIGGALALGLMAGVAELVGGSAAFALALLMLSAKTSSIAELSWFGNAGHFQAFFSLLVLLTAGLCAWRARASTPRRSALLGVAIGETLLYRSTLIFFPPVLAAAELLAAPRGGRRALAKSLLPLLLVPYLFLLPWSLLTSRQSHRLILLEDHEADAIVMGGALGLATKPIELPALRADESALSWAASETLRHPVRYGLGVLERLRQVFLLHPLLIALGLFGAWRSRKDARARAAAALAAYLLLVHCLMSFSPEYFEPLWPLAAILASRAFPAASPRPGRWSRIVWAWFAVVTVLALVTVGAVLAYAGSSFRDPPAVRLDAAIIRNPGDAWLLSLRGRRWVYAGNVAGGAADLSRAAARAPDDPEIQAALAWAELLSGEREKFLARAPAVPPSRAGFYEALLLGCGYLRIGERGKAGEYFARSFDVGPTGAGRKVDSVPALREIMSRRPLREYRRVIAELAALAPDMPSFSAERRALDAMAAKPALLDRPTQSVLPRADAADGTDEGFLDAGGVLDLAERALAAGDAEAASARLSRAMSMKPEARDLGRAAALYQGLKRYPEALRLLDRLVGQEPRAARWRADRGVVKILMGADADADLKAAIALDPRFLPPYLTLGTAYEARGRREEALRTYETALAEPAAGEPPGSAAVRKIIASQRRKLLEGRRAASAR